MEGIISGGGGCCIARHGHHHGPTTQTHFNPYGASKVEQIMFRFRPIAPRPVIVVVGGGGPTTTPTSKTDDVVPKRNKRSTAGNNDSGGKRRKKSRYPDHQEKSADMYKVTLPLLPETPDLTRPKCNNNAVSVDVGQTIKKSSAVPTWRCFGPSEENDRTTEAVDVVGSSVTIERVTDTWMDGSSLGRTDEERKRRLEEDTCPGFISDAWNHVSWTNGAYRRMVKGEGEDTWRKERRVAVKLEMREKVELPGVKVFTAVIKVQYGKKEQGREQSMTVPCDGWRMDNGGFAWRLDINAALCLGR